VVAVVDDDASLRRSVKNLLSSAGFEVETFESAEAFLGASAPGQTGQLGCLVLDLRMPGMSGLELVQLLRARGTQLPIAILTAHGEEDAQARCLALGVVAFLTKPFSAEELVRVVTAALVP
jgi:FixJ family two-component response regulator